MTSLKPGERLRGQAREEVGRDILTRYKRGETIREIAASITRSYGFVQYILIEYGVEMRSRGDGAKRKAKRR